MRKGAYQKTAECDMIYWRRQLTVGRIEGRREENSENGDKSCAGCGG